MTICKHILFKIIQIPPQRETMFFAYFNLSLKENVSYSNKLKNDSRLNLEKSFVKHNRQ